MKGRYFFQGGAGVVAAMQVRNWQLYQFSQQSYRQFLSQQFTIEKASGPALDRMLANFGLKARA
ncbi:MAG: hypothetical protein ACREMO_08635 [Gemmatimonadales bacterium]